MRIKRIILIFALLAAVPFFGPAIVLAQEGASIEKASPVFPAEVTADNIAEATVQAVSDWQFAGGLAGVLGIVYVLVLLSKYGPLNKYLQDKGLKWIRPIVAAVYGALLGTVTAFSTGMGTPQAIITGLIAGLGSTGFHELLSVVSKKEERERRS